MFEIVESRVFVVVENITYIWSFLIYDDHGSYDNMINKV